MVPQSVTDRCPENIMPRAHQGGGGIIKSVWFLLATHVPTNHVKVETTGRSQEDSCKRKLTNPQTSKRLVQTMLISTYILKPETQGSRSSASGIKTQVLCALYMVEEA